MTRFKLLLVAAALLIAGHAHGADKSILGLELGMKGPGALESMASTVREGAFLSETHEASFQRYRLSSKKLDCRWTSIAKNNPCIALVAFGKGVPDTGGLYSIRLEQYFDEPMDFATFEKRLIEVYGAPAASIKPATQAGAAHAYWVWSSEVFALTSEARDWAQSTGADASNVSEPATQFKKPVLHLGAYIRDGQVRGMRVLLFDPGAHHEQKLAAASWMKRAGEEKTQRSKENVKGLQLR